MRSQLLTLLVVIFPFIFASAAFAQPMSGSYDVGGGGNHYTNIVSAAQALTSNGVGGEVTFNVYPGTYTGQISLGVINGSSAANTITFHGIPDHSGQRPVVTNPSDDAFYLRGTAYCTIENFEFTGCGGNGGVHTYCSSGDSSHHIIIKDNYFHNQANNYNHYSLRCHHITLCANEVSGGHYGLRFRNCPNVEAFNNMIYGATSAGLHAHETPNSHFSFNSILDNSDYSLRYGSGNEEGTCRYNNVYNYSASAAYGCVFYQSTPSIHDYNNFYAPNGSPTARYFHVVCHTLSELQAVSGQEAHSISVDPMFISATDLHISGNSPCVGAGIGIPGIEFDIDGERRHTSTSIGCDEITGLNVALALRFPPCVLPPGGGCIDFSVEIENNADFAIEFDAWSEALLPTGQFYGPLLLRQGLVIQPGSTLSRNLLQMVPGFAPAGDYQYFARCGIYPDRVYTYDSFDFTKRAFSDIDGGVRCNWTVTGWDENEEGFRIQDSGIGVLSVSPNPFNAETDLSFKLRDASQIKLAVYDVTGREASVLAEGWYPGGKYRAEFNGTELASGMYFAVLEAESYRETVKLLLLK